MTTNTKNGRHIFDNSADLKRILEAEQELSLEYIDTCEGRQAFSEPPAGPAYKCEYCP